LPLEGRNAVVYVDSIIEIARYMYKNIILKGFIFLEGHSIMHFSKYCQNASKGRFLIAI